MADRSGIPPCTPQYSECRPRAVVESLSVPLRVWRPPLTCETLRRTPLAKTLRPDAARVERVPFATAGGEPFVLLAWRPAAQGAADTWWFRLAGFFSPSCSTGRLATGLMSAIMSDPNSDKNQTCSLRQSRFQSALLTTALNSRKSRTLCTVAIEKRAVLWGRF